MGVALTEHNLILYNLALFSQNKEFLRKITPRKTSAPQTLFVPKMPGAVYMSESRSGQIKAPLYSRHILSDTNSTSVTAADPSIVSRKTARRLSDITIPYGMAFVNGWGL